MTTPPYLQPGDTIGILCPAGFMQTEKVQAAVDTIRQWGFNVKVGNTVGGNSLNYFSGTDDERLKELQEMMDDAGIKAILCARGGYGTGRIIERINFEKFVEQPKWVIGFSDITVLHCHLFSNYKIASLHAPMANAFNDGGQHGEFVQSLYAALTGKTINYKCEAHIFNKAGKAEGRLAGGNLALLAHIVGTSSDIKTKNKILFIEDIGEYIYNVDRMLYQLKRSGKLKKLAGLIIGKFSDPKDTDRPFGKSTEEVIRDIVQEYDYPVCFNFPVGHEKENLALKAGLKYSLDVAESVSLTELTELPEK